MNFESWDAFASRAHWYHSSNASKDASIYGWAKPLKNNVTLCFLNLDFVHLFSKQTRKSHFIGSAFSQIRLKVQMQMYKLDKEILPALCALFTTLCVNLQCLIPVSSMFVHTEIHWRISEKNNRAVQDIFSFSRCTTAQVLVQLSKDQNNYFDTISALISRYRYLNDSIQRNENL